MVVFMELLSTNELNELHGTIVASNTVPRRRLIRRQRCSSIQAPTLILRNRLRILWLVGVNFVRLN